MSRISFDARLADDLAVIARVPEEKLGVMWSLAMELMTQASDGGESGVVELAQEFGAGLERMRKLLVSMSTLLWALVQYNVPSEDVSHAVSGVLPENAMDSLGTFFAEQRESLLELKDDLASVVGWQYRHLAWRIDVELARRTVEKITEPSFMLRLDMENKAVGGERSVLLQADYANLKKMQTELELAVAELKNTHCQRVTRYIK